MDSELRRDDPKTAIELWRRRVRQSGDRTAFLHKEAGAWVGTTWTQADEAARELAAGLVALGVSPGDRVCLLSDTRVEWALCDVAILLAGAVTVPIYASSTPAQCEHIIRDSGAKVVIVEDTRQMDKLVPLRHRLWTVTKLVQMADDVSASQGLADFVTSLGAMRIAGRHWLHGHPGQLESRAEGVNSDSTFTIIYTSGTTGIPKGVVLSHENLTASVASAARAMSISEADQQFLFLPLAHVLGRELEWAVFHIGCPTWYAESPAKVRDNLLEARPTFMAGVPRIFEKFHAGVEAALAQGTPTMRRMVDWALRVGRKVRARQREGKPVGMLLSAQMSMAEKLVFSKVRAKLGLDRCRFLVSGGAPLAPEIAEFFHAIGLLIVEGYGLTETMAAVFLNRPDRFRFGTVGPALDVVESKIADDGEILLRGPSIFREYHNDPASTAQAIDADGWFHTGDIGVIEDGFLRITDRKKDIIVTAGGKNVTPQPIENAIKARTRLVGQIVVIGDRRPYCIALVTPSEEAVKQHGPAVAESPELRAALQKEIDAVNAQLAPFETIKRFAVLPADFTEASGELTPSLKVKRSVVLERYEDLVDEIYARPMEPPAAGA